MKSLCSFTLFFTSLAILGQGFDTEFKYSDTKNKGIEIQNSFPKGGLKYIDPFGKNYVYTVFWTRITNTTSKTLNIIIDFPTEVFTVPNEPEKHFKLFLPSKKMMHEDISSYNYGLDVKAFLDQNINNATHFKRQLKPKDSYLLRVVALYNKGIIGVVRAKFQLKEEYLYYNITGKELYCGKIMVNKE